MVDAAVNRTSSELGHGIGESPVIPRCSFSTRVILGVIRLIARLPFSVRSHLGWILGFVAGLIPTRELRVTRLQLMRFLNLKRPGPISRRVFAHAGRYMFQVLDLKPLLQPGTSQISCKNWSQLQGWLSQDRPVVVLTAHTGNWDLLAAYAIARGIRVTTIGREARSPVAQQLLESIRDSYGVETIWRSDRSGLKRIVSCLREPGRVLAALIDQDTRVESVYVPFFGTPAKTPSSLVTLGKKLNALFVTTFIFQTGLNEFEIFADQIDEGYDTHEILTEYHKRLEALIHHYPDQWVWFHKRWRSQADSETMGTTQYLEWLSNGSEPAHE